MSGFIDSAAGLMGFGGPDQPEVRVTVPGKTPTELELMKLQIEALQNANKQTPEQAALAAKATEYYNQMIAQGELSPEEEAAFNKEYELSVAALEEKFGIESKRAGATQMAELTARGVMDTTTGENAISRTQEDFAKVLESTKADMLQAKEFAKSDMELAKQSLATSGYALTSGMSQAQMQTALEASLNAQNYYLGRGGLEASANLTNALMDQALQKSQYIERLKSWGAIAGMGGGMMKSGGA